MKDLSDNMTMKTGSNLKFNDQYEYLTFDLDQEFLLGELKGEGSFFLKEKLIKYRRHSNNVSQMNHYGILKMIKNRIIFIKNIVWKG